MLTFRSAALAVGAAIPLLCAAQPTGVSLSGVVDGGVRRDSGGDGGGRWSVGSGLMQTSRLTLFGVEDLGAGLRASIALEDGLNIDTGTGTSNPPSPTPNPSLTFGRTSAVALGSDAWGYVSLGRQYTPIFGVSASSVNDPFGANWLGGVSTVYNLAARASNAIGYTYGYSARALFSGPPRKGFGAAAMVSLSEEPSGPTEGAGEQLGFNASWGDGQWFVGYGYHRIKGSNGSISANAPVSNSPTTRQQSLVASYEFPFGRLHVGVNTADGNPALDRVNWHIGAALPWGERHSLRLLYGRANDQTAADADFSTFQIGYQYNLSRRTNLYAGWGTVSNDPGARTALTGSVGSYAPGSTPRSFITGVRHVF
jgi:predicted porin